MSKDAPALPDIGGFTPVPDDIVKRYGILAAAVWGRMWRYAQMQDGVCRASQQRIAADLGINRRSVVRAVAQLKAGGLLADDYHCNGVPSHYQVIVATSDYLSQATSDKKSQPVTNSHTTCDKKSQLPVTNSHSKIVLRENEDKPETTVSGTSPQSTKSTKKAEHGDARIKALVLGYQEVLGYKVPNWGQEAKAAKSILAAGYEPADVFSCYRYLKQQEFWRDKHLALSSVYKQLGPWVQAGKTSAPGGNRYGPPARASPALNLDDYRPVHIPTVFEEEGT